MERGAHRLNDIVSHVIVTMTYDMSYVILSEAVSS
jgi:ABC-type dipeptide/oligopeptide/nickel transport system permease subunit